VSGRRGTRGTFEVGEGRHAALVLADAGTDMWILRAWFLSRPDVGTRFSFNGIEWTIVWRCEKGFGA